MRIQDLYVYPVKSCAGVRVASATVSARGLEADRRWMLVDEQGGFVTARTEHRLVLVRTALGDQMIRLAMGKSELSIPLELEHGTPRTVKVWRSVVDALEYAEGSAWFSALLDRPLALVYMPDSSRRATNPEYSEPGDIVSFADGYPLLVVSQASLDDLNARLEQPVSMARFRPNLVVSGATPFAEDDWRMLRVGELTMRGVKLCDRCSLTTVDPNTGAVGKEPLKTLARYRMVKDERGSRVLFGMNVIPEGEGCLHVGGEVFLNP